MADTKITEKYEFKTDIITSYTGTEQRIALRNEPRHYLSYDYTAMKPFEAQWLRAVARMKQSTALYIPMWHTPLYLSEPALKDSRFIKVEEPLMFDARNCQAIEVFVKDTVKGTNKYYRVATFGDGGVIGLGNKLETDLNPKNAYIYPLIKCSIQPINSLNYVFSNGTDVTMNFEDVLDKSPVTMPSKYLFGYYDNYKGRNPYGIPYKHSNNDVFTLEPQWIEDNSVTLDVEKQTVKLDNDIGVFSYDSKNNLSYDKNNYSLILMNKAEINNMVKFFYRVKGKYKSFYMPSWVNDFTPCFDIQAGNNFIYTEFDSLYKYYLSNSRKNKIIIFTKDFKSYILNVMSLTYEIIGNIKYGKLLLSSPIDMNLPLSNIKMMSYFNHVRLDDDTLQLNYESTQVAQVDITTMEVDDV